MADYFSQTASELYAVGYRQISRAFGIVARVDISDEEMMAMFLRENFGDSESGVPSLPLEDQRDQYRRCYSRDKIRGVPAHVMDEIHRLEQNNQASHHA